MSDAAGPLDAVRSAFAALGRIVGPHGIDEAGLRDIGGVEQWVAIRGQDRRAPILLFLHGGPGGPISDVAFGYQRPWEDFFTVVNWDQRGFGRSAGPPDEHLAGTLNRERYRSDAIELIEMLTAELGQRKIILVGQSWGTVLGMEVARARPDLLHALVLQGLAANWMASPRFLYEHYLTRAVAEGDDAEAERLRALGPPPVDDVDAALAWPRMFGRAFPDAHTWHNVGGDGDSFGSRIEALRLISPDLTPGDHAALAALPAEVMAARYAEAMGSVIPFDAARDVGTSFAVPVVVMMGSHDWQTHVDLARDYFDLIEAPAKKWIEFPHAAHVLNLEQPGLSVVSLVNEVLPFARET